MFQASDSCYFSELEALSALAAEQNGSIKQTDQGPVSVSATAVSSGINYTLTPIYSGSSQTLFIPISPANCSLITLSDSLILSWLVVLAWAVAWGFRVCARSLGDSKNDD